MKLEKIDGRILHVNGVDILDGTPLLDIKPYTAKFDLHNIKKNGWPDEVDKQTAKKEGKEVIAHEIFFLKKTGGDINYAHV